MIVIPQGVDTEFSDLTATDPRGLRGIREILVDVLSRYHLADDAAAPSPHGISAEPQCLAAEAA